MCNNIRILVVENDANNVRAAKAMLSKEGYDLTIMESYANVQEIKATVNVESARAMIEEVLPEGGELTSCHANSSRGIKANFTWSDDTDYEDQRRFSRELKENIRKNYKMDPPFDVVLTDLMMPTFMSPEDEALVQRQEHMPYGPFVVLRALQEGVPLVGILTNENPLHDPFVHALNRLHGFTLPGIKVICSNDMVAYMEVETGEIVKQPEIAEKEREAFYKRVEEGELVSVKNWAKLLEELLPK